MDLDGIKNKKAAQQVIDVEEMTAKNLKKIINGWHRVLLVCVIWGLACLAGILMLISMWFSPDGVTDTFYVVLILSFLYALAITGTLLKSTWGRNLGSVMSYVMLLAIPIGTILGLLGIFGYGDTKILFGSNRVEYSKIKNAYKKQA